MNITFEDGFELGLVATQLWRAADPPLGKVYLNGYRIHHGEAGVIMAFLGTVANAPALAGFGTALALDDAGDSSQWFGGATTRTRRPYRRI